MKTQEQNLLKAIAQGDEIARFAYADWLQEQGREEEALLVRNKAGLVRKVKFEPAFDKTNPDPNKNFGVHGVTLRMTVVGMKGAVSWVLYTNWQLPHVQQEWENAAREGRHNSHTTMILSRPQPVDLSTHYRTPRYEGQTGKKNCPYIPGGLCYSDGSGRQAEGVFELLTQQGDEAVWKFLEARYLEDLDP